MQLRHDVALVGIDSWADGRTGDYWSSSLDLNDYHAIKDFIGLSRIGRIQLMQKLADEAAQMLEQRLLVALDQYRTVLVVTHVPPFSDACLGQGGRPSTADYLPHFCWHVGGEVLRNVTASRENANVVVLCGHTHARAPVRVSKAVLVKAASAEYGDPQIEELIGLEELSLPA